MKTTTSIITFVIILVFSSAAVAQQTENQLFAAIKHTVKPEKIDEYKDLMKKFASACKEYDYPFIYSAWQSSFPDFYYFYPIKDYNTAVELNSEAWKIIPNMESDFAKNLFESIESWEQFFIRRIDSLTYNPENGPVVGVDLVYAEWWIHYNKTWTGWNYRNTFKKAIEMDKEANFDYPITRFQSDIGMKGPAIITVFWGKNMADLYNHAQKDWEILGDDVREMINNFDSTTRKFEKIPFWFQKDLSNIPE